MHRANVQIVAAVLVTASCVLAQDSVSKTNCLPGDAVSVYADQAAAHGSEQVDHYVVDLTPFTSSWGTQFGIAPIIKASKTSASFFGSLVSSHGISRDQLVNVPFPADSYPRWSAPGFGVNNDAAISDPGAPIDVSTFLGNQFAVGMAEFSTTDQGGSYNGIIGGFVNLLPTSPGRLYVTRVVAAANGCNGGANASQPAMGSVDANGNILFRADGFNTTGGCGLASLVDNNLFYTNIAARNPAILNVISNDYPGGRFDAGATFWPHRNQADNAAPPTMIPASVTGSAPIVLDTNFAIQYCRGPANGSSLVCDNSHMMGTDATDQRGTMSYTQRNCTFLASTHGLGATLAKHPGACEGGSCTDTMLVFGLGPNGSVTGRIQLRLPTNVIDNSDNFHNLIQAVSPNEFDNYRSQVAFRGGNGQIALGTDSSGRLLAAAQVDHPFNGFVFDPPHTTDWDVNYIAVARAACTNGAVTWTMAAYNHTTGGKSIYSGPTGAAIGKMVPITGDGNGGGPAVSSPMIDSAGNVWFVSAIEMNDAPGEKTRGLLRAVYNPTNFSYRLELVLRLNQVFAGQNSGLNYKVNFIDLADSNSISSGAVFSQNISQVQHLNGGITGLSTSDPRNLGGLVIGARVIYDRDADTDYQVCTGATGTGADQDYNVLLYIGALNPGQGCATAAVCNDEDVCTVDSCQNNLCVVQPRLYGDTNGDASVDVSDLACVLDGSQNEFSDNCTSDNADLFPCLQNGIVDSSDISAMLDGFRGIDPCCGPPTGACCTLGDCTDSVTMADCSETGGQYQGDDTTCSEISCPPAGACCTPGNCTLTTEAGCNGAYLGDDSQCSDGCPAFGGCCVLGVCHDSVAASQCQDDGGIFHANTVCANVTCPTGACCVSGACTGVMSAAACVAANGAYQGDNTTCAGVTCPAPPAISISEIRIDQLGTDNDEYFELAGPAGTSLNGITYLVVGDGAGGSGVIEVVVDLSGQTIPASGFFVVAEPTFSLGTENLNANLNFENTDNVTHFLVRGFSGANGQDLDTNDDGVLNTTPWTMELDRVAVIIQPNPPTMTEWHYGPPTVGPEGTFAPGHVFRCSSAPIWRIGPFDPASGVDSPGAANACTPAPIFAATQISNADESERSLPDPADDAPERSAKATSFATVRHVSREVNAAVPTIVLDPVGGSGGFIEIAPGQQVTIDAFVTGVSPMSIRGYQVAVESEIPGSGSAGSLQLVGAPIINTAQPDFVFNGILMTFSATVSDGTGRAAAAVFNENAVAPVGSRYLARFVFVAAGDASGDYLIDAVDPGMPGGSNLLSATSQPLTIATSAAVVVVSCGSNVPGDSDCDGDVDLTDYTHFQGCFSGRNVPFSPGCGMHDADHDGDVDLIDAGAFLDRFGG